MSAIKDGCAAFPCEQHELQDGSWNQSFDPGMSLRQYAAIKLQVPDSGDEWLDDMIRASLRNHFAAKMMHAELMTCCVPGAACDALVEATEHTGETPEQHMARCAYEMADAMLKVREVQS
jgi:hypothetical protein